MNKSFIIFVVIAIIFLLLPNSSDGDCHAVCSFGSCCINQPHSDYCRHKGYGNRYFVTTLGYKSHCSCSGGYPNCYQTEIV